MIIIKQQKVEIEESQISTYQEQFRNQHLFVCPNFLALELQGLIKKQFLNTSFTIMADKKKDGELLSQEYTIPSDSVLVKILHFYLNQKEVIDAVKKISGVSTIKSFQGRVYKFEADQYSFDNWHDDLSKGRLLGMSLNLSEEAYKGGEFKIRNTKSRKVITEIKHKSWGSSHFFRISNQLQHKVEKVSGHNPRIAFAGWFTEDSFFKG